jgi:hypothetical protein
MKWFRRWVYKLVKRAWDDHDMFENEIQHVVSEGRTNRIRRLKSPFEREDHHDDRLRADSMNFKLYKSVGGHILETQVYDERNDQHNHTLYMILDEEDFAAQVSKAIMLEMMKQ